MDSLGWRMSDLLTHLWTWLGAPLADGDAFFFLCLLLFATMILNFLTGVSDLPSMVGNFCSLAVGATLGLFLFPNWSPPLDLVTNGILAMFSGMTVMGLVNMALLRRL
ncbi:hypothetical protein G5V57_10410 [Nordella sp. HKS 07]|uniref:hypothetical protein n=1 Tax=Nordella sp. HKS 07 TaxID=2712222 RepID=UPI0013E14851|nr:hypothetical protein [Nordella sp. HKS 07]QIG48100.1 hypothetical protein G5V57_10410 [Nordella sp. HKS 07]